jgi:hypothetical protein
VEAAIERLVINDDVLPAQHRDEAVEESFASDGEAKAELGLEARARGVPVAAARRARRADLDGAPSIRPVTESGTLAKARPRAEASARSASACAASDAAARRPARASSRSSTVCAALRAARTIHASSVEPCGSESVQPPSWTRSS